MRQPDWAAGHPPISVAVTTLKLREWRTSARTRWHRHGRPTTRTAPPDGDVSETLQAGGSSGIERRGASSPCMSGLLICGRWRSLSSARLLLTEPRIPRPAPEKQEQSLYPGRHPPHIGSGSVWRKKETKVVPESARFLRGELSLRRRGFKTDVVAGPAIPAGRKKQKQKLDWEKKIKHGRKGSQEVGEKERISCPLSLAAERGRIFAPSTATLRWVVPRGGVRPYSPWAMTWRAHQTRYEGRLQGSGLGRAFVSAK